MLVAMRMRMGMAVVLVAHGLAVGCRDHHGIPSSVTAPSPSGPTPIPQAPSSGPVSGGVYDTAYRPLAGAVVEALDGSRAGTSTTADAEGAFTFEGVFDGTTRFRASRDGHVANVLFVDARRTPRGIDFYLLPTTQPVNLAGDYTMTVTADAACTDMPAEARSRTYRAAIVPNGASPATYFDVSVYDARFMPGFDSSERFAIVVAGDYVSIWMGDRQTRPAFVEQLAASTYVAFGGGASATVAGTPPSIELPFTGFVDYCAMPSPTELPVTGHDYVCPDARALTHVRCQSSNHRLTLTPR